MLVSLQENARLTTDELGRRAGLSARHARAECAFWSQPVL
ncbi:hypothetical protein [Mesorhizobium sp.]|nr:hypothetical protein [Mesorhizobium sp.]